ncbi:MAG: phage head closure protein [Gammaproteobacteria bacterium]|nr:phage head closure protein [Gammaproteobacteria bacterium]
MRIGARRHRITLQRAVEAADSYGERIVTWTKIKDAWASYKQPGAREAFSDGAVRSEVDAVFECRYVSGVTAKDRVLFDSRTFDIEQVTNPDGRKRWTVLVCRERF